MRQIRLRPDDSCAQTARRFVSEQLRTASAERRENALLVTSELVTNAYQHGRGTIELRLGVARGQVLIEVIDEGEPCRVAMRRRTGPVGGWGLRIVDRLASEWGVHKGTTHVWAKLPLD
jgi:anti-sigma regulatory factor (Ser/Thr protein kinase)